MAAHVILDLYNSELAYSNPQASLNTPKVYPVRLFTGPNKQNGSSVIGWWDFIYMSTIPSGRMDSS